MRSVICAALLLMSLGILAGCKNSKPPGVPALNQQPFTLDRQGNRLTVYFAKPDQDPYIMNAIPPIRFYATCWFVDAARKRSWDPVYSSAPARNNKAVFIFAESLEDRKLCRVLIGKLRMKNVPPIIAYFD